MLERDKPTPAEPVARQLAFLERIVQESQLHYNAMQIGAFDLLRAREQQIESGVAYIEALRDYALAAADIAQLLSGRLPGGDAASLGKNTLPSQGGEERH